MNNLLNRTANSKAVVVKDCNNLEVLPKGYKLSDKTEALPKDLKLLTKTEVLPKPYKVAAISRASSTRPVSFITEQEIAAMVASTDKERDQLLITTLFQCALRVSEAMRLRIRDKASVDGRPVLLVLGKGNKPRIVALPEKLSYHLGDYAHRHHLVGPDDRFFPFSRVRAWQIIKAAAARAGIDRRIYTHLLRHGGAIARLKRTGNPKSLQLHLGHSDMKMTMRYLSTLQACESLEIESKVEF